MKKYVISAVTFVIAIGAVAFTKAKTHKNVKAPYYWYQRIDATHYTQESGNPKTTSSTGCNGIGVICSKGFDEAVADPTLITDATAAQTQVRHQ